MRRLEAFVLALAAAAATAQPAAELPAEATLQDVLRIVSRSPRIAVSEREADAARAERRAAAAPLNPSLALGHSRPAGGERTVLDASRQQQATLELPVPVFGQRAARIEAAERQVGRAESALRLTHSETRRQAALAFVRLLALQEQDAAHRAALGELARLRDLVAGRLESGMASPYDLARAEAELAFARLGLQRVETDLGEQVAVLAALADAPDWHPRAAGSVAALQAALDAAGDEPAIERNPASRVARDETSVADARIEVARRERLPVPSFALGRTWTGGPFGAANFVGVTSEIPILDDRRALQDKAQAEAAAARERERALNATLRAEVQRHRGALRVRRAALRDFERTVYERQAAFQEMAEAAYRLGRGTLFELLDARRKQLDAATARLELMGSILESQVELLALAGDL